MWGCFAIYIRQDHFYSFAVLEFYIILFMNCSQVLLIVGICPQLQVSGQFFVEWTKKQCNVIVKNILN